MWRSTAHRETPKKLYRLFDETKSSYVIKLNLSDIEEFITEIVNPHKNMFSSSSVDCFEILTLALE